MKPEADEPDAQPLAAPEEAGPSLQPVILGTAAVLLAGALGLGIATWTGTPEPAPAIQSPTAEVDPAPEVSPSEAARLEAQLLGLTARLLPVDLSSPEAQEETARLIPLPEVQAKRLIADALAGRKMLARVVLWDNVTEDGDVVAIASGGVTATVSLTSAPQTFVLPYEPGGTLAIIGVKDGRGGITVGVELATGPLPLPPLRPGEVRTLPLF